MSQVVVLRLSADHAESGRLVGLAEAVASGRTAALRVGDDPIAVVLALLTDGAGTDADGGSDGTQGHE